jgi:hypothetical protein
MKRIAWFSVVLAAIPAACVDLPAGPCAGDECGGGAGGGAGGGDAGPGPGPVICNGPPGLYVEGSCTELAEGVRFFQPQHWLWTDGADKQRWVYLPPDTQIDTSDPDDWVFPVGTRFYKTFLVDGRRIETRLLEKVVEGDGGAPSWTHVAYLWSPAQDSVTPAPDGVVDALGTNHDVPSSAQCLTCHTQAAADFGLGFSAIQLNHDLVGVSLATLREEALLTDDIEPLSAYVPGNAMQRAALGYLHANCGHCHGGDMPTGFDLKMRLLVGTPNVEATDTYMTAVDVPGTWAAEGITARIEPGMPAASAIHVRIDRRDFAQMPPLGTEVVDDVGIDAVETWIMSLGGS